jgi:FAD/FMN-containing dehydrogenase
MANARFPRVSPALFALVCLAVRGVRRGPGWCGLAGLLALLGVFVVAIFSLADVHFSVGYWLPLLIFPAAGMFHVREQRRSSRPVVLNDVHSRLNETAVDVVVRVDSLGSIQAALARARERGSSVSICGGRHAMGGQQFCAGGMQLDTTRLSRVLTIDLERRTVEVEAGIQWPALVRALERTPLTFAQKQTGADDLSIGGALSANVHGRGLTMRPFISDVESFVLVRADGEAVRCSRDANADLFALAIGGYGLFGVIYSVTLRLVPRRTLERVVQLATIEELIAKFDDRIANGFQYGDFQFAIDSESDDFLRRGVFSCYRPVADREVPEGQRALSADDWRHLLQLAHTDKSRAFDLYTTHYLATSGQIYRSDAHQLAFYAGGYHDAVGPGSEMITEIYVPRARLADFMHEAADKLRACDADVVYGTVRLIERDDESFLAWATEPWACVIFNLHVEPGEEGRNHAAAGFRLLIDLAIARGGSYYLTYHRWATRAQVEACYPQFAEFLQQKREQDPQELFQSEWYLHYRELFAAARPAAEAA